MFADFGDNIFTRIRKKMDEPIVVKTNLIQDSFSFWPFTVLGRNRKLYEQNGNIDLLLTHEKTHWDEQKGFKLVPWLWQYVFSDDYRAKKEKEAMANEVREAQRNHSSIDYDNLAKDLANNYHGAISIEAATAFVYGLRDTNPYT